MQAQDKFFDLAAFDKKTGEYIGNAALMDISRGIFQNAYLGYRIFNQFWKKGFGKELVEAVIELSFTELKLHRIEAGIDSTNFRSIRLARSLKMRKEGMKKRALFLENKWKDLVVYALTTEDWNIKFRGDFKSVKRGVG
jgi:ribosomal-protein-alanine N-acetyltransferase